MVASRSNSAHAPCFNMRQGLMVALPSSMALSKKIFVLAMCSNLQKALLSLLVVACLSDGVGQLFWQIVWLF